MGVDGGVWGGASGAGWRARALARAAIACTSLVSRSSALGPRRQRATETELEGLRGLGEGLAPRPAGLPENGRSIPSGQFQGAIDVRVGRSIGIT